MQFDNVIISHLLLCTVDWYSDGEKCSGSRKRATLWPLEGSSISEALPQSFQFHFVRGDMWNECKEIEGTGIWIDFVNLYGLSTCRKAWKEPNNI